ncbi:uncharacterized protein LOC127129855 [Lathyrus oleraceus]|uniref:uncharacterized protein LOC127129855 n=1 Tax=Pisum sativum TaxID=3888 RepID=UPI0021D35F77|nr:uncharacterized protein LOC127129855 [Pisum sativum]
MTATCEPIFKLLRKDQAIEWNSDCQQAFENIKGYLQEPPILIPPILGKPLFMYLIVLKGSMGCYITQKSIKGSVLFDYLADHHVKDYEPLKFDFPYEDIMLVKDCETPSPDEGPEPGSCWKMMFDGSSNCMGHGVGVMLMNPNGGYTPFTARLCFECTNNIAEYEACILGIEAAIDTRIKILKVYGDSVLVIFQVKGEWETRDENLIPYRSHIMELIKYCDEITFHHVPRAENQIAGALAMLASMFQVRFLNEAPLITIERKIAPAYCLLVE